MLTTDQVRAIQDSFALIAPHRDQAAIIFYGRLFEIAPETRAMFPADMTDQGKKLMHMLGLAVRSLDALDALIPVLKTLGARHRGYGVTDAQYDVVGEALLWTLEHALGESYTPFVHNAWGSAYGVIASTMIGAAPKVESVAA